MLSKDIWWKIVFHFICIISTYILLCVLVLTILSLVKYIHVHEYCKHFWVTERGEIMDGAKCNWSFVGKKLSFFQNTLDILEVIDRSALWTDDNMPSTTCIVPDCSGRGYHILPKHPVRRGQLIHAIKRGATRFKQWIPPSKVSFVFRRHCTEEDYVFSTTYGNYKTSHQYLYIGLKCKQFTQSLTWILIHYKDMLFYDFEFPLRHIFTYTCSII